MNTPKKASFRWKNRDSFVSLFADKLVSNWFLRHPTQPFTLAPQVSTIYHAFITDYSYNAGMASRRTFYNFLIDGLELAVSIMKKYPKTQSVITFISLANKMIIAARKCNRG